MKAKSILPIMIMGLGLGGSAIAATVLQAVPNSDTSHPSGLTLGDTWKFSGLTGQIRSLSVDTRDDNGDGTSNLDPILFLVRPNGTLFASGDDELACSRLPVCGFACPSIGPVTLDADGTWKIVVRNFGGGSCTGGAYNLTLSGATPKLQTNDGVVPSSAAIAATATLTK